MSGNDVFQKIYDKMKHFGRKFYYVATGALTNLSILLGSHPDIANFIEAVFFAGGALGLGDVTPEGII